jgi:hypothetical protein
MYLTCRVTETGGCVGTQTNTNISALDGIAHHHDQAKWSRGAYSVFWADHITIRQHMGCSPYFQ